MQIGKGNRQTGPCPICVTGVSVGDDTHLTDNKDHLGLGVLWIDEEIKNIDMKIQESRKSLFDLLGPTFAFKCPLLPYIQPPNPIFWPLSPSNNTTSSLQDYLNLP